MGWYEALKDAVSVADKLRNADLKQRLAEVQVECAKLAEENARLRQERIDLIEQSQTRRDMQFEQNVYWRLHQSGNREGPFCPKCLDGDRKAARMAERPEDHFWSCPVCHCVMHKPGPDPDEWRVHHAESDYDPFQD